MGSGPRNKTQGPKTLNPRFLLDTHVLVKWLARPHALTREQLRVLREAVRRREPVAISGMTLLEIALLSERRTRREIPLESLFETLRADPQIQTIPLTLEIAAEVAAIGRVLDDPADRTIVATARVHHLKLITSDEPIIESGLVPVIA